MESFILPDDQNWQIAISKTEFYQWLNDNDSIYNSVFINMVKIYLSDIGFVIGKNKLTEKQIRLLSTIFNYHFEKEKLKKPRNKI